MQANVESASSSGYLVHQQPPISEAAKYREKYRRLKRHVKDMIFLNAAYCDEVARIEEKVVQAKEERRYLLRRLLQYQPADVTFPEPRRLHSSSATSANASVASSKSNARTSFQNSLPHSLPSPTATSNTAMTRPPSQSIAQLLGEVDKRRKKINYKRRPMMDSTTKEADTKTLVISKKSQPRHARRRIATTSLELPIVLGSLTIYCLGEVVPMPGYFTAEYIYPVGFCSSRSYTSITGSSTNCLYTCKIVDSGSAARFVITPEGTADVTFVGNSPSECLQQLLGTISASRGNSATAASEIESGVEFFGLSHPVVLKLIRKQPGAKKFINYRPAASGPDAADDVSIEKNANLLTTNAGVSNLFLTALTSQQQ